MIFYKKETENIDLVSRPAYTRKRRVTTTLLSLGADPNVRCLGGQTAVHAACHSGSVSLLATLLKYGGDLYIHDVHRQIPT